VVHRRVAALYVVESLRGDVMAIVSAQYHALLALAPPASAAAANASAAPVLRRNMTRRASTKEFLESAFDEEALKVATPRSTPRVHRKCWGHDGQMDASIVLLGRLFIRVTEDCCL
jgi:hypothetical protein